MGEQEKRFLQGLPVCVVFAFAAAVAAALYRITSDYSTYLLAVKYYSMGWVVACVLCLCCGLLQVPQSPGVIFGILGFAAFGALCALVPANLEAWPGASFIVQSLPAWLFIFAWAFITLSAARSEKKNIRLSSWVWLTVFVTLAASWGVFHTAQNKLLRQRNQYIAEAREKTLAMVEQLDSYKQNNDGYPETLDAAGVPQEARQLSHREKGIRYFGHGDNFVLTFEDPMLGGQKAFSYDTTQGGWFPKDPKEALNDRPYHMFLGILRKR